jgi:PAS domain S-box-containing protein
MQTGFAHHRIVTDPDDRTKAVDYITLEVNPVFEQLTGLKAADIIGKRITQAVPGIEKDSGDWIRRFGQVAIEGTVERYEQYSEKLNRHYAGVAYQPVAGEFIVLVLDVTSSKEKEIKLEESEQKHSYVFETMKQGVVYVDPSTGNITACNRSAARILGMTADELSGEDALNTKWNFIHEDGTPFKEAELPLVIATKAGQPVLGTTLGIIHPKDGRNHWVQLDAFPCIRQGETTPYQVILIFSDISETKQIESNLRQLKEKAEEADALKSAFVTCMSHELRTPLNGIVGNIDLVLSNKLLESCREENLEGLHIASQCCRLLISVINDILDLSKIEGGMLAIQHTPFSVRKMIDDAMNLGQALISQKKKRLKVISLVDSTIRDSIYGDCWRLQQVLTNLIYNAIKFTERGSIKLEVSILDEEMLEFSVQDTGRGIPPDHLESIFQPFSQVEEFRDTRKFGGTGLGLTISKKLVERMGGTISVESSTDEIDHGSIFRFTLPYEQVRYDVVVDASSTGVDEESNPKKHIFVGGKILVVEDDLVSRKVVKRMLEKAGFDVITAVDGEKAVATFDEEVLSIDLILMDIQMPVMDGLQATSLIRSIEREGGRMIPIPILALSAGAMKCDVEKGFAVGMTDYMTKPISYDDLMTTMTKYLGKVVE